MATKDSGFDDDVKNVKSNLYMQKDDDKVYSKVRGLGPGMAARRLEGRGVDIKGLTGNRANPDDLGSYKKGGKVKKMNMGGYAGGGMPMVNKGGKMVPSFAADGVGKMKKGGMAGMHKMPNGKMMKDSAMKKMSMGGMANGGSASKRADGIATKGKTKGKMLKKGGMAC